MLAMAAQCCLGVLSSPGQSPNWCGLKNYKEISEEKFRIANEKPFIFMESAIIALIEGKDPCHDIGYELMQLKEAMNSGNLEGLYLINDAFAGIEPSATPEMSKYIIKFGVREVINELIETLTEISNVRCNNQDSMNNSQIMDNIKKRQNSITSGVTTVVKSLYMRMQNYQALQPGMEFFINHTETKAIDRCVRAIDGFYKAMLIMLKAFTGSASDSEDCLCALNERKNNTLKLFTSGIYILYYIVEFWAYSKADKNFDSLLEQIILIQTGQDTMLNNIEAGLKTEFDAMDFKLKSVCGIVDNNTGCECCKFDMAEEKAKSYYNAAYDVLEHVTSSINKTG
ncbi:uncharacterized protein LOC124300647 isoform X2 [Neodiprion virginianus]|uniref:uncharacterized protein LOC124300647 isoform X2 n=1 Tax=Neodiprion virginianus TaxID=2961670 RepID=UPI001EE7724A|nr:uncharacterized protein LOC124300647 isoform X2 [Neodiprion virginianus]